MLKKVKTYFTFVLKQEENFVKFKRIIAKDHFVHPRNYNLAEFSSLKVLLKIITVAKLRCFSLSLVNLIYFHLFSHNLCFR